MVTVMEISRLVVVTFHAIGMTREITHPSCVGRVKRWICRSQVLGDVTTTGFMRRRLSLWGGINLLPLGFAGVRSTKWQMQASIRNNLW